MCIAISLSLAQASHAVEKKRTVLLKFNQENGLLRVVFEGEEAFISKIKVTTSSSQIKMEFPGPIDLRSQKDLPFEIVPSEKSVVITPRGQFDLKFFRLPDPPRFVLDIQTKERESAKQEGVTPEKQTDKPGEQQTPAGKSGRIVIDAGHGGFEFGVTSGSLREKDLNLSLARDVGAALAKKGKKVFFVRKDDQYVPMSDRIRLVNQVAPDVFISIHATQSPFFVLYETLLEERGFDDYRVDANQRRYAAKSKALSDNLERAIEDGLKEDVIRRSLPLPLVQSAGAPAVFLEYPFSEVAAYDQQKKTRLVQAIVSGLLAHGL